jgi:ubiquinone/menaquinone biosynthesis C-methylase UbiE
MTLQKDPERTEERILHKYADFPGKRVLEVGCGEGRLTWKYAASARHVTGIDPDEDSLKVARADCPVDLQKIVSFARGSSLHIPFSKETFDIAILAWSL